MKQVKPPLNCAATEIEIKLNHESVTDQNVVRYQWTSAGDCCCSHAAR